MDAKAIISQRIKHIRKTLKLTQQDFANDLKISQSHAGAMELGTRKIPERIIKIICFTYNINENWLKAGKGEMFKKSHDLKLEEAIKNFNKLDDLLQDYVLKQLRLTLEYQQSKDKKNK
ncbi:MAG: helix-turn-helix domain-containing protein [Treponema sp.]|nr:helix-turn-helix domain-containing protein [Treponema sp.]